VIKEDDEKFTWTVTVVVECRLDSVTAQIDKKGRTRICRSHEIEFKIYGEIWKKVVQKRTEGYGRQKQLNKQFFFLLSSSSKLCMKSFW
jgi:hypothetical protein